MTKEKNARIRKNNMKLYSIYYTLGYDLVFLYGIKLLFLAGVKGISTADVVLSVRMLCFF